MPITITLSPKLISQAKTNAKKHNRSVAEQIEHWAIIGKTAEENPDLHYDFIKGILIGLEEAKAGHLTPYEF